MRRPGSDRGSTVPLILGLFLIAMLLVAGSVAAGDAFVQQRQLQDLCDGAAVAAASSADLDHGRHPSGGEVTLLVLGAVQDAVQKYRDRDPSRLDVEMQAVLSDDSTTVTVGCAETRSIAFGSWFGFGGGVEHRVTSTAQGRLRQLA